MAKFLITSFALMVLLLLPLSLMIKVTGFRALPYYGNTISDGVHEIQRKSSFIRLYTTEKCEQMYGFLPCSKGTLGHFFLIVVYEYLLFHGEYYMAMGGERIFKILGPNSVFGASAFHILGFLPEALILFASGLLNSKEVAQEYVLTGVGLLAGSTILLLTLIWGTCVVVGSQESTSVTSNPSAGPTMQNHLQRFLSQWTGAGLVTDLETCYTARIMVLSVIPFIIILVPTVLHLSASPERIFIILCLVVSIVLLLSYFFYQIFEPWIQKRRLEYIKHEHFVVDILKHLQEHTIEKLLQEDGSPNIPAIRKIFEEADQDSDKFISVHELKQLFMKIRSRKYGDDKTDEVMEEFDLDDDGMIDMDEFVKGFTRWIDETKDAMGNRYHSIRSLKDLYEILQPWLKKKREEHEMMKHILSDIYRHVESTTIGTLYTEDGKPNISAIRKLFECIDHNKDNVISRTELKELICNIKFGHVPLDTDEKVDRIIEQFDASGDEMISVEEFITGFSRGLHDVGHHSHLSPESKNDIYQNWEMTEKLLQNQTDRSAIAWMKAILLLVIGIVILGLLAEPLIKSVGSFSRAINVPSFFISFILVPLATNARIAISAVNEASRKKQRTNSLTLSEIYGGVFINNMLGLTVLLSLIYFRGLAWNFSAEVLSVLLVCGIMGCIASLSTSFPVWISAIAFLLYPLSLVLVYILDYDFFV
ncbi:unnamed protein product [Withania somnifera]